MRYISSILISFSIGLALIHSALAQELDVAVSHKVSNVSSNSDGTSSISLTLTIQNKSNQDISHLRLLPLDGFYFTPNHMEQSIEVDSLNSGVTVEETWSLISVGLPTNDPLIFEQLMFAAEAVDVTQSLSTFPIHSQRETN